MFRIILLVLTGMLIAANVALAALNKEGKTLSILIGSTYSVAVFLYIYTH